MFAIAIGHGMQPGWQQGMSELLLGSTEPARIWSDEGANGGLPTGAVARVPGLLHEDRFDRQPLLSPDGNTLFVCQARLDNRDELLKALQIAQPPSEIPDSFLLQQAFLKWGEACVDRVYGDFAFAAYLRSERRAVCAVDHGNHYRLFYRDDGCRLLAGTQLAALSRCPGLSATADPVTLGLLAEARGPRTKTPFVEIKALSGGHALRWTPSQTKVYRWWNPETKPAQIGRRSEELLEQAREVFAVAVASCLRSSSPISATLSGGLDSGLVIGDAAPQLRARGEGITAYTAAPAAGNPVYRRSGWEPDDTPYAAETAALHPNLQHVVLRTTDRIALDLMTLIHQRSGTPIRNGANHLWIDDIARDATGRGSRVILTGAHGNFGISHTGLGGFRELVLHLRLIAAARLTSELARSEVPAWKTIGAGLLPQELTERRRSYRERQIAISDDFAALTTIPFREEHMEALLRHNRPIRTRKEFVRRSMSPSMLWSADPLAQWGIELRDPTGDRRLLELLLSFPLAAFAMQGRWRGLARELGRGRMPDSVRLRRTQGQQAADYASAVQNQVHRYRKLIAGMAESSACRSIFDLEAMDRAVDLIVKGEPSAVLTSRLDRACDAGLFLQTHGK